MGRTPWSAGDALVPSARTDQSAATTEEPTRGSAADEGVRPTICVIARKREGYVALGNLALEGFQPAYSQDWLPHNSHAGLA
jgi:hypothetical protein